MTHRLSSPDDYLEIRHRVITGLPLELRPVELLPDGLHFTEKVVGHAEPKPTLLRSFLRLRTATDRGVLRFAERWGDLHLCQHGHPVDLCCPAPHESPECPEHWRTWAHRFAALIELFRKLEEGVEFDRKRVKTALDWPPWVAKSHPERFEFRDLPDETGRVRTIETTFDRASLGATIWDILARPELEIEVRDHKGRAVPRRAWKQPSRKVCQMYLAQALNRLLFAGRVRREIVLVRGGQLAMIDGSRWLFGLLVQQLVQECVQVKSLSICTECESGFKADRRTAKYCQKCRDKGVPLKQAQQARRDRLRAKGRTSRNTRPRRRRSVPKMSLSAQKTS